MSNRFAYLTPRQRYHREYHECRMFNSYLNTDFSFEGDIARQNAYRSWCLRFSGLPKMPKAWLYRVVERSVRELLNLWPAARNIRICPGHCHNCRGILMSFQLPPDAWRQSGKDGWEHCGYWCSECGWSNAGSRPESPDIGTDGEPL